MKAIIWTAYGSPDVLRLREIAKPVPVDNGVLVKNHAGTVTSGDARMRGFRVSAGLWLPTRLAFGLTKPRIAIPGMDFAGEVAAVGKNVSQFKQGDRVCGTTGLSLGAHAEYVCIAEDKALSKIPDTLPYENAVAGIFGGLAALYFLRDRATIHSGQKVLVNGASGAVGTMAVQLAKFYQTEVTGVCSAANHALVKSIGADQVIDYTREDFTQNGNAYDIILDTVGNLSYAKCRQSLSRQGKLILINTGLLTMLQSVVNSKLICGVSGESKADLAFLLELADSGKLTPVIDRTYTLEEIAGAHRHVDTGHKKGNVVLAI